MVKIAPSILAADLTRVGEEVLAVTNAGAEMIHFDVMDNHYVPNLTFGPGLCNALHERYPRLVLDIHLMVMPVDSLIEAFAKAGASYITIHPEATLHLERSVALVRNLGCKAGLAFNPTTPLDHLSYLEKEVDLVLLMSVNPGFGGQKLLSSVYTKLKELRIRFPKREYTVSVDGGVDCENAPRLIQAGAEILVSGSTIFQSKDYKQVIQELKNGS